MSNDNEYVFTPISETQNTIQLETSETSEKDPVFGVSAMLSQTMARQWELIDWYNSVIATLATMELNEHDKKVLKSLQELLTVEYGNFAILEKLNGAKADETADIVDDVVEAKE